MVIVDNKLTENAGEKLEQDEEKGKKKCFIGLFQFEGSLPTQQEIGGKGAGYNSSPGRSKIRKSFIFYGRGNDQRLSGNFKYFESYGPLVLGRCLAAAGKSNPSNIEGMEENEK
ncbi:hypothetical protein V6N11_017335 [Hibiscus sabdariffa]|uniref:Uncharacterized protein n=1 Tax=Hibiscus sabdariffa TaxID=183260 RepID=A0ABR2TXP9_9ROSI